MLVRFGLIGIALVVAAVVLVQTAGQLSPDPNERPAVRLTEEVTRTNRTAGRLDTSFANVLPPSPPGQSVSMSLPGGASGATGTSPGAPSQPGTADNEPGASPEPTPDRFPQYNNPTDLDAQAAADFTDEMVEELKIQETEYTKAVEEFYNEWSARYNLAVDSHKRFRWRVDRAGVIAAEYFQRQSDLTSQMTNPQRQEVFRQRDLQEQELYRQWQLQAHEILEQSNAIMAELRQLNLEITKVRLSANFLALLQGFHTIPHAITQLHNDLALFRARSEQLQLSFSTGAVHNQ